ncbi:phage portal protein [Rhodococcus sp. 14-2496-1d]|uniref:phage portal protein n=1 Tax=Rhodococcus sp. 14-2496-1d TaxID=2023146 RepID=UPI000B9A43A8|nr:phage portal protein [Rhodococcus sp. 14-2496-1d]OZF40757.1 phage portal protein [Rhodococcus sp. 14-2496-1d]
MAFVVSEGTLRGLSRPTYGPSVQRLTLANDYTATYAELWKKQPAVRTSVSFLARNIAQLGLHAYRRVSDTDRVRLTDHPISKMIGRPNARTTRYRMFDALVHDLGIYDNAFWLKMAGNGLIRIPPWMIEPKGDSWLWPEKFIVSGSRGKKEYDAEQVIHFHGYSPDGTMGTSPLESLRRTLAEEWEAGRMREQTLRNGARMSGYLKRPASTKQWSDPAREQFRTSWKSQYSGGGPEAGGTPILEDGMDFTPVSQTAEQLQYIDARKLTREEVASAYYIPPPMIGILDHATFSNITEQHKMLYQDTLGPWLTMITEEFALQLLPDLGDTSDVYLEFNLKEKLKGTFVEEAQANSSASGRPWMTTNEIRARQNLPEIEGGDDIVTPLNVLVGGQASPRDSAPVDSEPKRRRVRTVKSKDRASSTYEDKATEVLTKFFRRQARIVLTALGAKADAEWWDEDRWNSELSDDLLKIGVLTAGQIGPAAAESMGFDPKDYDADRTLAFLRSVADSRAGAINSTTKAQIEDALASEDEDHSPKAVFEKAETSRVLQAATALITTFSAFATAEAGAQLAPSQSQKRWITNSPNSRSSHAAMNGETVGIDDVFSNGMAWPGDPVGGVDETAGCQCSIEITLAD